MVYVYYGTELTRKKQKVLLEGAKGSFDPRGEIAEMTPNSIRRTIAGHRDGARVRREQHGRKSDEADAVQGPGGGPCEARHRVAALRQAQLRARAQDDTEQKPDREGGDDRRRDPRREDAQGRPYTPEYTLLLVSEALHDLELKLIDEELKPEEL